MDFKDLYIIFTKGEQKHTHKDPTSSSPHIITSHSMEKLLKNDHSNIIAQFNAIVAI